MVAAPVPLATAADLALLGSDVRAELTDRVRAEPFEEIELRVGALFGLEEEGPVTENRGA